MKKDLAPAPGSDFTKWPTFLRIEDSGDIRFDRDNRSFRMLIENLPVLCYIAEPDPPFTPIYTSLTLEKFGYSLNDWQAKPKVRYNAIHKDDRRRVVTEAAAARAAGREFDHEYRLIAGDGTEHWVRDRGRFIQSADGKVDGLLGVIMEVTDRKRAEEYLREAEERLRKIFETANDIIFVVDLEGNYLSVNPASERILGYSVQEALSMNMSQVMEKDQLQIVHKHLKAKLDGTVSKSEYEINCFAKDGRAVILEVSSSVITKKGLPVAVQGIARDITVRKHAEAALKKNAQQYREIFENSNDLIFTHDLRGNITSINTTTERTVGYTREEACALNVNELIAPDMLKFSHRMTKRVIAGAPVEAYELELISKDGKRVPVELTAQLIIRDGVAVGVQGNARDLRLRKKAESSLRETVSILTSTLESSNDGIVVVTSEQKIAIYNQRFLEMWHLSSDTIEKNDGQSILELVKDQLRDPGKFVESTVQLYTAPLEVWTDTLEFKDGRVYERYSQPHYLDGKPVGRVVSFRDITERRRNEEKLRHHALHDTLTNLPNRAQFMNHLKRAIERSQKNPRARFAVLFLDLDRFKIVNDSLGHIVGDDLLIDIAKRLQVCLRPGDIVARLGGDEFTILLNRTGGQEDVENVAQRLLDKLSSPYRIGNYEVFTSASVGIILSDNSKRRAEDYLRDADSAMYRAKDAGRSRYAIFDHEMHVRNMQFLQLETDLRQALERNEFEVYYQPIVRFETRSIQEFEALIRWRHPKRGLLAPSEFMEVAEETGLVVAIGQVALRAACSQIATWQKRALFPLSVSVNLSARQLMNAALVDQVKAVLRTSNLAASQLKLEVTETTVMENSERALEVLSDLDKLGVRLSTDDFGTGYSSLGYLHRFPFSRLKVDKSFIKRMDDCMKGRAIVKTILTLGQNLGIEVVAEGIESQEQFTSLRNLGFSLGQGYYFSKPVNSELAERMLFENVESSLLHGLQDPGQIQDSAGIDAL